MTRAPPDVPIFEGEALETCLERLAPGDRTFVAELARDGLALIDLGEEGRALCERAVAETEGYFAGGEVTRVQDAWLKSKAVRRLSTLPELKRLLQLAYGREPYPFQTLNFRRGSQQEVHSDAIHFHSQPERFMCGLWIALEDITDASGPLIYRPGSHKMPILTMQGAGVNHDAPGHEDYVRTYLPALGRRLEAHPSPVRPALLKKGQAVVWAANLAHGGAVVADPASTRRSLVVHYFFEGCLPFTPMTSDMPTERLSVRLPVDISRGFVRWPRRAGRPLTPAKGQLVDAFKKLVLRRVVVG